MTFKQQLIEMDACQDAIDWIKDRTIQQAWNDCHCGDWMLWLLEQMKEKEGWLDEKEIMLLGCWCSRRALKYIPEGETRSLKAIEAKEKWARGEITKEEVVVICNVAKAVINTAWIVWGSTKLVANSAEWTAAWNVTCAFAKAATGAANVSTWTSAWASAMTTVYDKESSIQADYIRTQFTPPKGELCLLNNN